MTGDQWPATSAEQESGPWWRGEWRVPFAQTALGEPEWEETHATPRVLRKSVEEIERKELGGKTVVYRKWKSAQEYESKGVK